MTTNSPPFSIIFFFAFFSFFLTSFISLFYHSPLFHPIDGNAHNSCTFRFLFSVVSAFRFLFDTNGRLVSIHEFKPRVEAAGNKTRRMRKSRERKGSIWILIIFVRARHSRARCRSFPANTRISIAFLNLGLVQRKRSHKFGTTFGICRVWPDKKYGK